MLNKFCDYWTELNRSETKMRFEMEKTFEISKRLATWASREKDFKKELVNQIISHEEYLDLIHKHGPEYGKRYKPIKRENNKKVVYELITD